jgi:N-methylhydantoinase A
LPVKLPIIDLHIIGAGGGSIAWIDAGGALNVGPRSAGAEPGPTCYGRGGTAATVTDANLVLGRLDPKLFHGGRTPLDVGAARSAVADIGDRLGLSVEEAALGIT